MARLGYNVENMTSMVPTMNKITQSATSLVDNAYNQRVALAQSQATLAQTVARTDQIGADTDLLKRTTDLNIQALRDKHDAAAQALDLAEKTQPYVVQQHKNTADAGSVSVDQAQRQAKLDNEAIAQLPQATTELPDPNAEDYLEQRDAYQTKYNSLLNNPATAKYLRGEFDTVDAIYQSKMSTQQTQARRKDFSELQNNGFIPSVLNPDAAMRDPNVNDTLVRGRMSQQRHDLGSIISQLPEGDAYKKSLQDILTSSDPYAASDTGVQDVTTGKADKVFDMNGRFNGNVQGVIVSAQQHLADLVKQGAVTAKPDSEVKVPFGTPNIKGELPGSITYKNLSPEAATAIGEKYGLTTPGAKGPTPIAKSFDELKQLARDGKIDRNEFIRQGKAFMPSAKEPEPGPGEGQGEPDYEGRVKTSNSDYNFPKGAPDTAGIDRNVWGNVMSEEGPNFGYDGSHHSVFGLWEDAPGLEGQAYQVVKQYGPHSPEAYNAVTKAWTEVFLNESRPWSLKSPGLQALVIADSQHTGGGSARSIINQMGGYDNVNRMSPEEAIDAYSTLRKDLWPDSQQARVIREKKWAIQNNAKLSGA